jgi:hypothetical protein
LGDCISPRDGPAEEATASDGGSGQEGSRQLAACGWPPGSVAPAGGWVARVGNATGTVLRQEMLCQRRGDCARRGSSTASRLSPPAAFAPLPLPHLDQLPVFVFADPRPRQASFEFGKHRYRVRRIRVFTADGREHREVDHYSFVRWQVGFSFSQLGSRCLAEGC